MTLAEESERPEHPWVQNVANSRRTRFAIPPLRCNATSNRTGKQCAHWATPGSTKCWTHGSAAGQVRRAAKSRVTQATVAAAAQRSSLAERLDEAPRQPWASMIANAATVDAVVAHLKDEIHAAGPNVTAEQVDRLVSTVRVSHAVSESLVRLGLIKLLVKTEEHQIAATHAVVIGVMETFLEHLGANEPEIRLYLIRAMQTAFTAPAVAKPRPLDVDGRHPEREGTAHRVMDEAARKAAASVPWEGIDVIAMSRSDVADLQRLRQAERERQLARPAIAAAPHSSRAVMQHPERHMPYGWSGGSPAPDETTAPRGDSEGPTSAPHIDSEADGDAIEGRLPASAQSAPSRPVRNEDVEPVEPIEDVEDVEDVEPAAELPPWFVPPWTRRNGSGPDEIEDETDHDEQAAPEPLVGRVVDGFEPLWYGGDSPAAYAAIVGRRWS